MSIIAILFNMVLSDKDIKKAIKEGRIKITPSPDFKTQLGSCSIDLRLGNTFRIFEYSKSPYIDPTKKDYSNEITKVVKLKTSEHFIMQPGDFVLAVTHEKVRIASSLLGRLEGRSSLGRLGIVVHSTASIFDPGWDGNAVLELGNLGRIAVALYPGMRICAMTFEELSSPSEIPYDSKKFAKYKFQKLPEESRLHEEK
ncbi:MAG: dCTP deaminase [Patescibacteria group bacterium]|nr:dCTP deaminase [Patescibacteria group bacterium]